MNRINHLLGRANSEMAKCSLTLTVCLLLRRGWSQLFKKQTTLSLKREEIKYCNAIVWFSRHKLVNRMHHYFSPFGVNGVLAKNTHKEALGVHCFRIELNFGKFRFLSELEKNLWGQKSETITLALV